MATPTWHALAPELIFEILRYACPELIPVLNPMDFPWHIGHICSSWRAVFVSSPQFWNTLSIDLDSKAKGRKIDPRPYEHALDIVNICIQRSKSRPLKFTYWMTFPVLYSCKQRTRVSRYCRSILAVLVAHSERWQDIDLSIGPPQLATLYTVRNKLSRLESVSLFLYPQSWGSKKWKQLRDKAHAFLFENTPKLKRTYLMEHGAWKINWSSVTSIHLCDLELLEEVITTLKQTERLEELNLFGVHDDIQCNTTPVRLQYLKVLYCGTMDLLLLFVAPELEELSIRHEFETPAEIEPALCKFFNISHRVRKLKLYTDFPEVVRVVFQHIPVVQELFLYGFEIPKQLSELSKLPKARDLNAITLGFRYPHECAEQGFIRMIKSWKKRDGATAGSLGPFENLNLFEMELFNMRNALLHLADPIDRLKSHFEEHNICYVVRDVCQQDVRYRGRKPFFWNDSKGWTRMFG